MREKRVRFYSQFVRKGDLCFDIGANVGHVADALLRLGATVVAVEPQSECVGILQRKYKKNKHIVLVRAAADEKEGVRPLHVSDNDKISSMSTSWIEAVTTSRRFSDFRWTRSEEVKTASLDSLTRTYGAASFCKIDVEGYELNVILGLSTPIPLISFEFTPEYIQTTIAVIKHLETLGQYCYNYSVDGSTKLALDKWLSAGEITRQLSLFTSESKTGDVYARLPALADTSHTSS
jgi:FkbM family methyltransferase